MSKCILAIDQGTSSSRVFIYDQTGKVIGMGQQDFTQHFPRSGWVEHDLNEIWTSVERSGKEAIKSAGISQDSIAGIGITNQRETIGLWQRSTGKPLHNAIVWQCRRTQAACQDLKQKGFEKKINQLSGLWLDPYFSATKLQWLLKNLKLNQEKQRRDVCAGTIETFLLFMLTGGEAYATDISNASRTMLMNLKKLQWDPWLLNLFGVSEGMLPRIRPTGIHFGNTATLSFIKKGIPILAMIGDQQSALYGQMAWKKGDAKCTFGTGSFILLNVGKEPVYSKNKLVSTVGWQLDNEKATYAIEGGAFICGAAVQWLRDGLGLIKSSAEIEALASAVTDSQGVVFVPALAGLGPPHWQGDARGVILGLSRGSNRSHIAFATLEGMALQNADILNLMKRDTGLKFSTIRVDGGATQNSLLMQMQADVTGAKVIRPNDVETTVKGAALMAGQQAGLWTRASIQKMGHSMQTVFSPKMKSAERNKKYSIWQKAVLRAFNL